MAMDVYVPNDVDIIHQTRADFRKRTAQQTIHLVQYERSLPVVEVELFYNGFSYTCPNNAEVWIRWGKKDSTYVYRICKVSSDRKKVYFDIDYQMSYYPGDLNPILELKIGGKSAGSSALPVSIDRNPIQETDRESHAEDEQIDLLEAKVDEHLANYNNPHHVTQDDVGLDQVDNTSDANKPVSIAQQTALNLKADKSTTYTIVEVDNLLNQKVDKVSGKGLSTNDFTNDYKNAVDANTNARHTHSNKATLDLITAAYTTEEKTKLSGIASGAQVNILESVKITNASGTSTLPIDNTKSVTIDLSSYATITSMKTYGKTLSVGIDSNYVITIDLLDADGNRISRQTVDLPLETMVVGGRYDAATESLILVLDNGQEISIPVSSLISGLVTETSLATTLQNYYTKTQTDNLLVTKQPVIDSTHKLESDLVDDSHSTTQKFVNPTEKTNIANAERDRHTHTNKALLDSYTQLEVDLAAAVQNTHSHSNKAVLDAITVAFTDANYVHTDNNYTSAEKTKLSGIANGAEVNTIVGVQVAGHDLTPDANRKVNILLAESVTYAALNALINTNNLIPGKFYRIIDYVTTTAQARTRSAGHQFDIIVQAISTNELSEDASACLHSGDTYFANSNLKAWVLKYSINNDTSRYAWADVSNGKGVIYYMEDEYHNACGYDFKNIQFARYKITACSNAQTLVGKYAGIIEVSTDDSVVQVLSNYMTIDTEDYEWCYTFDLCRTDYSLNAIGTTVTTPSGNIVLDQIQCTKCYIAPHESDTIKFYLNNVCMLIEASRDCMMRIEGFTMDVSILGGASATKATNMSQAIVGGINTTTSCFDGYFGQNCNVINFVNSLICAQYVNGSVPAVFVSTVGRVNNSCLIASAGPVFNNSNVTAVTNSTLKSGGIVFNDSNVDMVSGCTIQSGSATFNMSTIGYIADSNITTSEQAFHRSNISFIHGCSGSGATKYCSQCVGAQLYQISMTDNNLNNIFLNAINFTALLNSRFRKVNGCSFNRNTDLICTQDLVGCNFGNDVSYLNISSQNTAQTITNTNFHDIAGTDADHLKSVVIPEDYSTVHTVDIYARGHVIREID